MKAVKVQTDGSIRLPKEMLRLFPRASELAVWTEGDMIILKRLTPLKPSEIAQRAPKGEIAIEVIAARGTPDAPGEVKPPALRICSFERLRPAISYR